MISNQAERIRALQLEAKARRSDPKFGSLSRAAARALQEGSLSPLIQQSLDSKASPDDIVFAARAHGISGLLSRLAADSIPKLAPEVSEALHQDREATRQRARRLAEDLRALARRAEKSGLPLIPLKGAILGPLKYHDPSLRPSSDIDLLATGKDFDAWSRVLLEEGYVGTGETFKHRIFEKPAERMIDGFGEHPENPRPVELHPALRERILGRELDVTEPYVLSLRAESAQGIEMLVPSDDALLLHLLLHLSPAALGRGARLIQLYDFALLEPSAQAAGLVAQHLDEIGWASWHLAHREFPPALPEHLIGGLSRSAPSGSRRNRFLARPGLLTGEHDLDVLFRVDLGLCRSPSDAFRRCLETLPEKVTLESRFGKVDSVPRHAWALVRYAIDRLSKRSA